MIKKILDLDYKGVLPLQKENREEFYDRGSSFLDVALKFKADFQKERELVDITDELNELEEKYGTKADWVSCKKGVPQIDPIIRIGARTMAIECDGLLIPIAYVMKKDMSRSKKHEIIHCIRWPIEEYHNISQYFVPWRRYKRGPEETATQFLNLRKKYSSYSDKCIQNPDLVGALFGILVPFVYILPVILGKLGYINMSPMVSSFRAISSLVQGISIMSYSELLGIKNLNSLVRAKQTSKAFKKIGMNTKDPDFESKLSYSLLRLKPNEIRSLGKDFKKSGYNKKSLENYLEKGRNGNLRFEIILEKIAA